MIDLKNILKQLSQFPTDDLQKLAAATKKELEFRKLQDLVEYVPATINSSLRDRVLLECNSMNFGNTDRKACSQWLSTTNEP